MLKLFSAVVLCGVLMSDASADILYLDVCGRVTVNGEAKEGVTVEVIPCDGARLPNDWPSPPPNTASALSDPVTGINYLLIFGSGYGDSLTPGPAGSFTFISPLNSAWFTVIDAQLRFSYSNCPPVTISCADLRSAFDVTTNSSHLGKAIVDVDIKCPQFLPGDSATIGFWANKNGQALIKSLNGGLNSTSLANWLASGFPYLYGAQAGANNLTGKTNKSVASLFLKFFGASGPKTDAQILATALAVYVTDSDLAGSAGTKYGFNVSTTGLGGKTYFVGLQGSAIGLSDNSEYSVLALLLQANLDKQLGAFNRDAFNSIFSGINESGDRL